MKSITETNGILYLKNFDEEFSWCNNVYNVRKGEVETYFPLNIVTQQQFLNVINPEILNRNVSIDPKLYNKIISFEQNPEHEPIYDTDHFISPQDKTLKEHQITALKYMSKYNKYGFFLGTGTGKTLIAITWLMNVKPKTCLIVTKQKVVGQIQQELNKYIPNNNYIVTNYEQLHKYINETFEAFILDESHKAKNYSSNINTNCRLISAKSKYVYLFTGTPQDKLRHEILAQLSILDERVMPVKTRIHQRYFNLNDYYQPSSEKAEFKKELTQIIKCYTWGRKTEDVIEVTPENNYIITCEHPVKFYDELVTNRVINYNETLSCVADSKAILRILLRELCCGILSLKDATKRKTYLTYKSTKYEHLKELLIKLKSKTIIYYEFTNSLPEITTALSRCNKTYRLINGSTIRKVSALNIEEFKKNKVDFLVMQSGSGNAGIDLPNINNIIFYSLPESYIIYHQCKSRIKRIGQTKECNYYHLICKDSIEDYIYSLLSKKKSLTDRLFKQYI